MICLRRSGLLLVVLGAAVSWACHSDNGNPNGNPDLSGNPNGNDDGGNGGGDGGVIKPPPPTCGGDSTDAPAQALDFTNNLLASPAPPGDLTPANTPQIVVFGWDDIESAAGVSFVNQLLGGITNPDSSKGGANVNPNACYTYLAGYVCGDGTLQSAISSVTQNEFDMGNHTIDHLESNSTWSGIPAQYKDPTSMSWVQSPDGFGPGVLLDEQTWETILNVNDMQLRNIYGVSSILGFRAPRLEVNDNGLNAIKAINYTYDENLEEILADGYTDAAIAVDTPNQKGFDWIPWPYTLDNGSPGIWSQQVTGDKKWVTNYPTGIWEVPVYQVYVPSKDGLGTMIANTMLNSDNPMNCVFPDYVPADQRNHCFLSDGELNPGDAVKEVTSFDFNTFVYSRMTKDQWLTVMKHTFLMRYYGNRAPLTYGAHPIEYTSPYDSYTLEQQGNNYGYRDVVNFSTFSSRQEAMTAFVQWIKGDATLSKDTYFLSAKQMVDYMKKPFDKTGKAVNADAVASPDSNALFTRLMWTGQGASINVLAGNKADIVFNVAQPDQPVSVSAGIATGALSGVSHIDIKYSSEVPFRIRLLTANGTLSKTVLLAGVGGDRQARIRVKDFFPGPEASAADVSAATLVDGAYMAQVSGIAFESAATAVTGAKAFNTHIEQITLHGVASASLCASQ
jgi:hypothetical protein